ncbi:MAG: hypothetical protein ABIG71_04655 [Candidatus Uhrbacteria bacterium]
MPTPENPNFLHKKYRDLSASPEVSRAASKKEHETQEPLPPTKPKERIQAYLDRLNTILNPEPRDPTASKEEQEASAASRKHRNIELLKTSLYNNVLTIPQEVPESYFDSIIKRHKEEGHGDIEIPEDQRQELIQTIIQDQENSLDLWVTYLTSKDAKYPDWSKYWAFRSMLKMGTFDKEKHQFTKRTKGSISPFPELNQEALAIVLNAQETLEAGDQPDLGFDLDDATKQSFLQALKQKNFAKSYAIAIEQFKPISEALLKITDGEWRTFPQGSDPQELVDSLKDYGTGWCIRGKATAARYLEFNNLEVFYSNDQEGNPTVPRLVIVRDQNNTTTEFRGIAKQEEHDKYIGDVVQKKLKELPDGKQFEQRAQDMKTLTELVRKNDQDPTSLTKEDLIFLYEIDHQIQNFGYHDKDPRIKELLDQRNPKEDAPIVLNCTPDQIATNKDEITEDTKAYIGPLFSGIFDLLPSSGHCEESATRQSRSTKRTGSPHPDQGVVARDDRPLHTSIEHFYTSFPEGRIEQRTIEIGGKTPEQYKQELTEQGHRMGEWAEDILAKTPTSKEPQDIQTIRLTVGDLGFTEATGYDEICKRAKELGLELAPAEAGPALRLSLIDQPMGDWFRIAMEPIVDRGGFPLVFGLARGADGSWLLADGGGPGSLWFPRSSFVFRRKQH